VLCCPTYIDTVKLLTSQLVLEASLKASHKAHVKPGAAATLGAPMLNLHAACVDVQLLQECGLPLPATHVSKPANVRPHAAVVIAVTSPAAALSRRQQAPQALCLLPGALS
jgi:hypothetical protein